MESVRVCKPEELLNIREGLGNFLFEMASQIQARLPDNVKILKKINAFDPRNLLSSADMTVISEIASHFGTLGGGEVVDVSQVEGELRQLRHTSLSVTIETPLLEFWSNVASLKNGENQVFPHLARLASVLVCLPISNATVERLFSIMGVIKTKLRNSLAISMVDGVLATRYGIKHRGETCANISILPGMMERFNQNMYDHVRARNQGTASTAPQPQFNTNEEEDEDEEMIQVLQDVEDLLGDPVFIVP